MSFLRQLASNGIEILDPDMKRWRSRTTTCPVRMEIEGAGDITARPVVARPSGTGPCIHGSRSCARSCTVKGKLAKYRASSNPQRRSSPLLPPVAPFPLRIRTGWSLKQPSCPRLVRFNTGVTRRVVHEDRVHGAPPPPRCDEAIRASPSC